MTKTGMPEYNVGDKVKTPEDEVQEIKGYIYDPEKGFVYKVTAQTLDIANKKLVDGVSYFKEEELSPAEQEKESE